MARQQNMQNLIARLMNEEMGMVSPLSGLMGQQAMPPAEATAPEIDDGQCDPDNELEEPEGFGERHLKIAKRFIELMGGADRAREIIDKVDECEDCLQLIDDDESDRRDVSQIEQLAGLMPSLPDLPTGAKSMNMASLYNPSAGGGSMQ
jgi:hypothetical protein